MIVIIRRIGVVAGQICHLACLIVEPRSESLVEALNPSPFTLKFALSSKHHMITEAHGIPLAVSLTGGNRNDVAQLLPAIQAIRCAGRCGRPRSSQALRVGIVVERSLAPDLATQPKVPGNCPSGTSWQSAKSRSPSGASAGPSSAAA